LWLLPASQARDKDALTDEGVGRVIDDLRSKFDWVLCDSRAGIERGATLAMRYADEAVIVTNPEVSSVRDSDRIIGMLDSKTVKAENYCAPTRPVRTRGSASSRMTAVTPPMKSETGNNGGPTRRMLGARREAVVRL
jgi:septum formation inhibitor-activating ATPase MinD